MVERPQFPKWLQWLPYAVGLLCVFLLFLWLSLPAPQPEEPRLPVVWKERAGKAAKGKVNEGALIQGKGNPSQYPGSWPSFRGPARDNIATTTLARSWPAAGPKVLWRIPVGEGHAGAAVSQGRVYLIDYDREKQEDAIRCLSLDTGAEIWRYTYSVEIKRNHGMSRTVPAVAGRYVVTIGPKCHVVCLDALEGKLIWKKDLVKECATTIPPWYAGQCPLIDGGRVILAPAGKPLMMALELSTGRTVWQTKGHDGMGMTHSSIEPFLFQGRKQYVYCAHQGVAGVAADDGQVLWTTPKWKINIANVPTPVGVGEDRLFFSGGYNSGCAMFRLGANGGAIQAEELFRLKPTVFGADQQTPILYQDHFYGIIPSGELACLDLKGNRLWDSGGERRFGLGPFIMAGAGLVLALEDQTGTLRLAGVDPTGYKELAKAKLLNGHDAWAPMALAGTRLILRDLTEMICVDLGG